MYQYIIIPSLLFLSSCSLENQPLLNAEAENAMTATSILDNDEYADGLFDTISIDSAWQKLAFQIGGCLTGHQYVNNGTIGGEGCTFNITMDWVSFFERDTVELTNFLLGQLSDTATTSVHTCPF